MLPPHLRWEDDDSMPFLSPPHVPFNSVFPGQELHGDFVFSANMESTPSGYPHSANIQVALLRTRYLYNKYLIYRPFIFKALHSPETFTQKDAEGAAECFRAALKWPIALPPPCTQKRFIPITFFWSQNMFGILVLLHLSQQHPMLIRVRSTCCGPHFDADATETVNMYLGWLRDMQEVESTANWCWSIVRLLYQLND